MMLVGLVGRPVARSLSPVMMRAAFRHAGIEAEYLVVEAGPEMLAPAVESFACADSPGFNVTVPLKTGVIAHCARLAPSASTAGAVNTMVREGAGWVGHNTDGEGFAAFLERRGIDPSGRQVVILGAGGAARGIAARLAAGTPRELVIANRDAERGRAVAAVVIGLAPALPVRAIPLTEAALDAVLAPPLLVVQATPLGTEGSGEPPFPVTRLGPGDAVADVVYRPEETPFLARARERGARTVPGWGMLLHQGAAAFTLWFGRPAPVAVMEAALREAIASR